MSKQQTAVEWLANELFKQLTGEPDKISLKEVLEQAKAMEKEQIVNTYKHAQVLMVMNSTKRAEQYYNETYESNGSDDHLPDVRGMAASVQKLIDKDIFNQAILAMEEMYGSGCDAEIDAYFRGAKWMRQELNKQI